MRTLRTFAVLCVCVVALSMSCMRSDEHQDKNTAQQYDHIADNLVAANGTWKNNWVSSFDNGIVEFVPTVDTRQYKGLELFFKEFKSRNIVFGVCKEDKNTYIEIYCVYRDAEGNEVVMPINDSNRDKFLVVTNYSNSRIGLDFDLLPATTEKLKIKLQKGRLTGYIDPAFKL